MTIKSLFGILVICFLANNCAEIVGASSPHAEFLTTQKCPLIWEQHEDNCYLMYAVPAKREDAKKECEDIQGGTLVNILTTRDRDFLLDYWNYILPEARIIWTGLKRNPQNRDQIFWDNGIEMQYTNWMNGEPNDYDGQEDCVQFIKDEGLNDIECYTREYPFICMKPRI